MRYVKLNYENRFLNDIIRHIDINFYYFLGLKFIFRILVEKNYMVFIILI